MADDISKLFAPITFLGKVEAIRQEYQVFRTAAGDYLVFSPSARGTSSYHMTKLDASKVEAVEGAVTKEGVTSGSLLKDKKVVEAFGEEALALRFDLLMALYILTALGKAEMAKTGRNLVFTKKDVRD